MRDAVKNSSMWEWDAISRFGNLNQAPGPAKLPELNFYALKSKFKGGIGDQDLRS
jgi:hypothetical protein